MTNNLWKLKLWNHYRKEASYGIKRYKRAIKCNYVQTAMFRAEVVRMYLNEMWKQNFELTNCFVMLHGKILEKISNTPEIKC